MPERALSPLLPLLLEFHIRRESYRTSSHCDRDVSQIGQTLDSCRDHTAASAVRLGKELGKDRFKNPRKCSKVPANGEERVSDLFLFGFKKLRRVSKRTEKAGLRF